MPARVPIATLKDGAMLDDQDIHVAFVGGAPAYWPLVIPCTENRNFLWCRYDSTGELRQVVPPRRVDVVLIDLQSGELMNAIRHTAGGTIPIMVIASRHHEDDVVAALDAGADMCVTPAMPIAELLARIAALVRRSHCPSTFNNNNAESMESPVADWPYVDQATHVHG